ncbi:hypothetical protein TNCV_4340531 [Trichonephila clavipes]|nr:hypothetical protein TNCV_4340531 [Trichonephila clavipes]
MLLLLMPPDRQRPDRGPRNSSGLSDACRSFDHHTGDSAIWLGFHPKLEEEHSGVVRGIPPLFPFHQPHERNATAGSDVVQSGRPIFDDFFQHLWPYIGNKTANVVFQMVKRLWLIRIDQ